MKIRSLSLLVALTLVGCKLPLFKRVDVPDGVTLGFDRGMSGSPTSIWATRANPDVPWKFSLQRFDGRAWKTVEVPPVFFDAATVPLQQVEALSDGTVLLLTTRKAGGAVCGLLTPDGAFTELSAALVGAEMATSSMLLKRGGVAYARLDRMVFKYEGGTFTRIAAEEEATFSGSAVDSDDHWVRAGDTNWRLLSLTFYGVYADDDSRTAKLEVLRSVNGGPPQRALLKAEPDDLMGVSAEVDGSTIITESYGVMGLVRGADDSIWVLIVHDDVIEPSNELILRKVVGDTITREERFGIDLATCSTSKLQPECFNPHFIGGQWPKGSPVILSAGLQQGESISSLLVQTADLR